MKEVIFMFDSKYNNLLTVLLIVAIIAIIGLLGYLGYSMYNQYYLDSASRNIVDAFEQAHASDTNTIAEQQPKDETTNEYLMDENIIISTVTDSDSDTTEEKNTTKKNTTINGYKTIGVIKIPKISIEYPILEKVTTQTLKYGIAYLVGPGPNEVGNTVYQGHNLRNGKMFSNLSKLENGNDIYITDESGNKIQYKVYRTFEANATDTSFYNRDTEGKREITLSTCTEDSATRTIVFAREV